MQLWFQIQVQLWRGHFISFSPELAKRQVNRHWNHNHEYELHYLTRALTSEDFLKELELVGCTGFSELAPALAHTIVWFHCGIFVDSFEGVGGPGGSGQKPQGERWRDEATISSHLRHMSVKADQVRDLRQSGDEGSCSHPLMILPQVHRWNLCWSMFSTKCSLSIVSTQAGLNNERDQWKEKGDALDLYHRTKRELWIDY